MWMCLPSWNSSQRKIFFRTNLVGLEGVEPVAIENEIVKGIHVIQFECFRVCPVYLDDYDAHPRNTSLWLDGNFKLAWRGDRISFIGKTSYMSFYLCNLPITRTFTPLWIAEIDLLHLYLGAWGKYTCRKNCTRWVVTSGIILPEICWGNAVVLRNGAHAPWSKQQFHYLAVLTLEYE